MTGDIDDDTLPPNLRYLKTLVTVLTATMILGLLTMIVLFVIRLSPGTAFVMPLPDEIILPEGVRAVSVTYGPGHYIVVTADSLVLIFGADGDLKKTIDIE